MSAERLHLQQASMSWRDSDAETRSDYRAILGRGADLVGFTETARRTGNMALLKEVARGTGYTVVADAKHTGADVAIAVRPGLEVLDSGAKLVNKGEAGPPPHGGHSVRFIQWVVVGTEAGNEVFFCEAHWVTAFSKKASRRDKHATMSQAVVNLVQRHGKGNALAFWAGDVNMNEETDRGQHPKSAHSVLTAGELTSIWDELRVYPATHGHPVNGQTIDVIGSYDRDRRVTAVRAKVWPRLNSDHNQVSAWYDVGPAGGPAPEHPCPTCGVRHRAPNRT